MDDCCGVRSWYNWLKNWPSDWVGPQSPMRAQTGAWDWTVWSGGGSVRGSTSDGPVGGGRGYGRGVLFRPGMGTSLGLSGRCGLERNGGCDGGRGGIVTATVTETETESGCDGDEQHQAHGLRHVER